MSNVAEIRASLSKLKAADKKLKTFGADTHRYELKPVLSEGEVARFETRHQILLPADFRGFLTELGNGGAGPFYGIFELGLFDAAGSGDEPWEENDGIVGRLAEPFPHSESWNLPDERLERPDIFESDEEEDKWQKKLDEEEWAPDLMNGAFPICHHGCAYRSYLVVSGPERGKVWYDGRASDGGIVPHAGKTGQHMTFADWYQDWTSRSLRELGIK